METTFWERLDILIKKESSRKEIAKKCGIAVNTIAMWKARKCYPTAEVAMKLAMSLNVTVEYLLTGEDNYMHSNTIANRFSPIINSVDPEVKSLAPEILHLKTINDHSSMRKRIFRDWIEILNEEELIKLEEELKDLGEIGQKYWDLRPKLKYL